MLTRCFLQIFYKFAYIFKVTKIKYYANENENKRWQRVNQSRYSPIDCNYIYKHVGVGKLKA